MTNRIRQLGALGQAVWLDFISRELLGSGKLAALVDEGVRGVTSNPIPAFRFWMTSSPSKRRESS